MVHDSYDELANYQLKKKYGFMIVQNCFSLCTFIFFTHKYVFGTCEHIILKTVLCNSCVTFFLAQSLESCIHCVQMVVF